MWGYSSTSELFRYVRVMRGDPHFGAAIVWGRVPIGFPVSWVVVPGCSRNSYGTSPYLWFQKKLVKFRQSTQKTRLRPAEFFWDFLSHSLFDLFRNLGDVLMSHLWIKRVSWLTLPGFFQVFLSKLLLIFPYSSKLPWYWKNSCVSSESWIEVFYVCTQQW